MGTIVILLCNRAVIRQGRENFMIHHLFSKVQSFTFLALLEMYVNTNIKIHKLIGTSDKPNYS